MRLNVDGWRKTLRLWAPPLVGIPAMLLLGGWFEIAHYFLFAHHLFWMIAVILLINPVTETLWPSRTSEKSQHKPPPQPSVKARQRREARRRGAEPHAGPSLPETAGERLARLQTQKQALDKTIEKLDVQAEKRPK